MCSLPSRYNLASPSKPGSASGSVTSAKLAQPSSQVLIQNTFTVAYARMVLQIDDRDLIADRGNQDAKFSKLADSAGLGQRV